MQTNFYKLLITSALALSFSLFACSTSASVQINQTIYKMGDNTNWSSPKLDDSDWVSYALGLPEDQNNYWVRIKLIITENSAVEQQAIFTSILGSYEIYWDNIKVNMVEILEHQF